MNDLVGLTPTVICDQLRAMAQRVRDMEKAAREKNWLTPDALDKLAVISIALDKTHDQVVRGRRR